MKRYLVLVAISFICPTSGWASEINEPLQQDDGLPAWTSRTQFHELGGARMVFVGIGQATSIAQAKARARSDAQAQFLSAVGGVVITSQKLVESSQTDEEGIARYSVSGERYTASASQGVFHDGESEFVAQIADNTVTGYFRWSLPTESVQAAREELARKQRAEIHREVEAYRLARQSRQDGVGGYRYAVVRERASAQRAQKELRISVEYEARRKARHLSKVALVNRLNGESIKAYSTHSGERADVSYSSTTGYVRSEVIAERVWWEGEVAVAESFLLGWIREG
jgi:hypothetical protein